MPAMQIKDIIQGCKKKDRKCQRALYLLTATDLMRVAQRYIRDTDVAKDVFQDAYIKIFDKIHLYDSTKGTIGAWTGRIVANQALEILRRKVRFTDLETLPVDLHPYTDDSPLDKISADELLALVNELPDHYRIVFLLYIVEGYSHKEIAEKLSITASTSRSQLVRAKVKLRSLLQKKTKLNLNIYGQAK